MSGCWGIGEEERLNIKQPHAGILGYWDFFVFSCSVDM